MLVDVLVDFWCVDLGGVGLLSYLTGVLVGALCAELVCCFTADVFTTFTVNSRSGVLVVSLSALLVDDWLDLCEYITKLAGSGCGKKANAL